MPNDLKTEVDLRGLNSFNSQLLGVLIGSGQGGDARRFIATEAGQLAWDISKQLGPRTVADGKRKIENSARQVFFPITVPVFGGVKRGGNDMQWLFASSKMDYLVGAASEDVQANLQGKEMQDAFRRANRQRGPRWAELGKRGKQRLMQIQRIIVSPGALKGLITDTSKLVGTLRASFAYTASLLVPSKPIPQWISKHFGSAANGRAIYRASDLGNATNPSLTFGSSAKGVQSNPYIVDKIARAVERRKYILRDKIKKVVKGYTYDWNTGQVFRSQVPPGGVPE
jgi:hypothetical protein